MEDRANHLGMKATTRSTSTIDIDNVRKPVTVSKK
jgi:hypothetical protein